ncbi:MAG: YfhO family protein [Candidatus Hodarchaeota archaeon]
MNKQSKKRKQSKKTTSAKAVIFFENLKEYKTLILSIIIILLPLIYYFSPFVFDNLRPAGTDTIHSLGQTHRWVEWREETGETVLWNPSIFAGEPIYPRITPKILHIDTIIIFLDKIIYWGFWYMLAGGLGIFFLLKYRKIPWYLSVIIAVAFIMLPDWQALISEGHNSKLRALMIFPWLILSFNYFIDKNNWLSTGLFALTFSWIVRTHHFQIVFYAILILLFLYTYPVISLLLLKQYKTFISFLVKFIIAILLTFLTSAQPLLTTKEYAEFSTRGGKPVKIDNEATSAQKSGGVSFEYATAWSFSPKELLDFFIPHFSGGLSSEIYDGSKYPHLKGKVIPGYWGEKPMNGNYATMGMILFLFALIGFVYYRKDPFVIVLTVFIIFSILLSFGRHFPWFYKLFYYYFPYFSKFRAPSMFLNVTFIAILILAGFGLKAFFKEIQPKDYKWILSIFFGGLGLILIVFVFNDSFSYSTVRETTQYDLQTINLLKGIRKELLIRDVTKLLLIMAAGIGIVGAYLGKKLKFEVAVILILVISAYEIWSTSNRVYKKISLQDIEKLEKNVFLESNITKYLTKQVPNMRAIVLGQGFTSNYYAYFYPTISGYSAIKLQLTQDIIEHNLYSANTKNKINWNVINMLNGKYIISPAQLHEQFLEIAAMDPTRKEMLYRNKNVLPNAWFVKKIKFFTEPREIVLFMNDSLFNPLNEALILNKNDELSDSYSGDGIAELINKTPNSVELKVETDSDQFLILSEIYYPKGWLAKIDDQMTKIYQVNHLLRGIKVPAGKHEIVFEFRPETYFTCLAFLWVGNISILSLIFLGLYPKFKKLKPALNN